MGDYSCVLVANVYQPHLKLTCLGPYHLVPNACGRRKANLLLVSRDTLAVIVLLHLCIQPLR